MHMTVKTKGGYPYLLLSVSAPLLLLQAVQLDSPEETQRLLLDVLVWQSGSERHLEQTSLCEGSDGVITLGICQI